MAKMQSRSLDPDLIVPWLSSTFRRPSWSTVLAGVGQDDCGVITGAAPNVVISGDFLNATPIAEQLGIGGPETLGRLAVAATLSDLLGSGAKPLALLVGVTTPHGYPESTFRKLMVGARKESIRWRVPIVGGDTKLGRSRAIFTCAIGSVQSTDELFLASSARAGDIILASGNLGTCAAATYVAAQCKSVRAIPHWARRAIAIPQLPFTKSRALAKLRIANGGIDISDGLAADLHRMCKASKVGATIDADAIPTAPHIRHAASMANVEPWMFSITSGGDFQFIATVPPIACRAAFKCGVTQIGIITKTRQILLKSHSGSWITRLPNLGHKDRQGQMFAGEIQHILLETMNARRRHGSNRQH